MDIAIIGMSVRFPGANELNQYWDILKKGICCVKDIPHNRKQYLKEYFETIGNDAPPFFKAAYLDDIELFDNEFFQITPKNAELMDPSQRIFLETAWNCFVDAGYTRKQLYGSSTGVYLGCCSDSQYINLISEMEPSFLPMSMIHNCTSVIAGRLSYIFNLHGPNIIVNTVCSSSLVSVHSACMSLKNKECDMAIAGGIQLYILPVRKALIGVESPDGYTRTFDDKAAGTGCGEGCGVILLKPLEQAIKDHDAIYAIIKGSAVNHDGISVGLSAPNPISQADVITSAIENSKINPATISYIEAHGTGTSLGDPIEIEGITKAYAKYTDNKKFCAIGSVKTNIGHLDGAAGIAGLIKTVLCLKKGYLVPTLFFDKPNRNINFENSPVYVCTNLKEWNTDKLPRRCGVSSFGLSGTNCHIIMEEAIDEYKRHPKTKKEKHIFVVSAKNLTSLKQLLNQYYFFIYDNPQTDFDDLCYTLIAGRDHYKYRIAYKVKNREELLSILKEFINQDIKTFIRHFELNYFSNHGNTDSYVNITEDDKIDHNLQKYINGGDIDVEILYPSKQHYMVHLPVYPYNQYPFWIKPISENINSTEKENNICKEKTLYKPSVDSLNMDIKKEDNKCFSISADQVITVFSEVLGITDFSENDDFFDLGGDSISAIILIDKIAILGNVKINLEDIVQHGTPNELVKFITELKNNCKKPIG